MAERTTTFCRICETLCGLEATVDQGRVVRLSPDRRHVTTGGYCCIKGMRQHLIYSSPDRLTRPMRRIGRRWLPVGWDEAVAEIGGTLGAIAATSSPDAVAMYVGTAAGFSALHPIVAQGLMTGLGSRSVYSSATQDCANKFAAAERLYGFPFLQPFPDLDRTDMLILVGGNPVVSEWSFGHIPRVLERLRAIEARGGSVVVVDPRRTETGRAVSEHLAIRPGTDLFFFLAFLHEVFAQGFVDHGRVGRSMDGLRQVEALARRWPPERVEEICGVESERLRELVRRFGRAPRAAITCSTGVNMGPHGTLAFWVQEVINAVTSNLDRLGGTLVGKPKVDVARWMARAGALVREDRSRVGDFRSVNDAFPGGVLADEILTEGQRQVRALICTGGNPLLTMAGGARLRRALESLELLVVVDIFRNETAELAHWVLPATTPLERPDLLFAFPLFFGLQAVPYIQATEAVVEPPGEARDETSIYADLARAAGVDLFGSSVMGGLLRLGRRSPGARQQRLLSALSRALGHGSFRRLVTGAPHGRLLPPHQGDDFLGARVLTDNGRVQLAPPDLLEAADGLEDQLEEHRPRPEEIRLIGRRAVRTHNSWTHNYEPFLERLGWANRLDLHPDDAARLGIGDGDMVDVSTPVATVRLAARHDLALRPGVVAFPHGWGHQGAPGLTVASRASGVNVNLLAADGPGALERPSGMARLTALEVVVRPAEGPRDEGSWSGVPDQESGARDDPSPS